LTISKVRNPVWWRNSILREVVLPMLYPKNKGTFVLREEWDNLIILDACRFDVFEEVIRDGGIKGDLQCRTSRGTTTEGFLRENFSKNEDDDDIVYVTANPYVTKLFNERFFRVIPVWKTAWNDASKTVLPEDVCSFAIEALSKYEGRRFVIHFIQPHRPFIGHPKETWAGKRRLGNPLVYAGTGDDHLARTDKALLRNLYKGNLIRAMPYDDELLRVLPGTTVVTADHGEALGDPMHRLLPIPVYGHPRGARIPGLVKVPWFISRSQRARVQNEASPGGPRTEMTRNDELLIGEKLKALGYD
jgi:hypothetical protein